MAGSTALFSVLAAALFLGSPAPPAAEGPVNPPPLTKEEERRRFHPRAVGMDAATRLAGYAKRLEMERATPLGGLRFRSVGPEIQGGRIVDIEVPRNRPESLIVAFATGGLWRTDNRGGSWTPLFDGEFSITIGAIAVADPDARRIWVGTGEANSSRTSYSGTGVFRTDDGGRTWANTGLTDSHHIGRILVDPRDPETVYVAAAGHLYTENSQRGIFRTTDGGRTWARTLFVDDRTGAIDLIQDPRRPDVLYAATWERARTAGNFLESGQGSGIWRSSDSGRTWKRLSTGLPSGATVGRIGLALAASRPDTIYAVLDNQERRPDTETFDEETPPGEITARRLRRLDAKAFERLDEATIARFLKRYEFPKTLKAARLKKDLRRGRTTVEDLIAFVKGSNRDLYESDVVGPEVYRSDDAGASWRKTHDGRLEKVFYSFGYYFGRIEVDPEDPERIYVLGVPLLTSADGGRSWKGLDARGVHVDEHALFIDPAAPRRIAIGNDGGLNLSEDYGKTWTKVNNLPVGQFTTLALDDADPYNILGGLQDNGVLRGPSTYRPGTSDPTAWKEIYGGDGSCVVVDPKDPNVVYAALQFGYASRLNVKTGEKTAIRPRPAFSGTKKEKPLRYNWVTPFLLSPHSREILYFGTQRIDRSFDRGETWTAISGDLTSSPEQGDVPFGTVTSISESPKKFGLLYAGTDEGKVWGTRDGGVTWKDLSKGLANRRWVTRVVASAFDEGTVYVSQKGYRNDDFGAYLWRSTDFGKTWRSLAPGLPDEPINTVREDPRARHLLYVGTDGGALVSLDSGSSWMALTGGLPRVPVHDLLVHPREGDLVLATHGRSVFVAEAAPLRKLRGGAPSAELTAFPVKSPRIPEKRGYGEHPWITWPREDPVVRIAYWSRGGAPAAKLAIRDENGNIWRELEGPAAAGFNSVEYDLAADPARADAAEKANREKALAKRREQEKEEEEEKKKKKDLAGDATTTQAGKAAADAQDAEEEEDDDRETGEDAEKPAAAAPKPLDPDLEDFLADPLRARRRRFLPPGGYEIEISAGAAKVTTKLVLKKAPDKDEDD